MKICAGCGQPIPEISVYCMFCGRKAEEEIKKEDAAEKKFLAFSKFCQYAEKNYVVDRMLEENVYLVADRDIPDYELVTVLGELENSDFQKKILADLIASGYEITPDLIMEIAKWVGAEEAFRFAISKCRGEFTPEEVRELGQIGCSPKDMDDLIAHCTGTFSFDQIIEILEFSGMGEKSLERIIPTATGKLTAEEVDEIFGLIDEKQWPLFHPHINRMDFEERLEVKEMFGI